MPSLTYGSLPLLIGADTIDLSQVNIFIYNVVTLQDCIAQTLGLFLNPASYFLSLSNDNFNINISSSDNTYPNSDWLPNNTGSGCQSYWYNCVGADQNYVAYQLIHFALFYSYINSVLQGNISFTQTVTVPVYSCNIGNDVVVPSPYPVVANLTFIPYYPLTLTSLSLEVIAGTFDATFTYAYSAPTNSNALPYLSFDHLSFGNIDLGINTLNIPVTLSQVFPQSSFNNSSQIIFSSSSPLINVTQSVTQSSGFQQVAMLSPNYFSGNSSQNITITASQQGSQIVNSDLTVNPIPISFLNIYTNGLLPTNVANSVFTFQLQELNFTGFPLSFVSEGFIANASNNYTNFFSTNMQVLSSDGSPLQAGFSPDALNPIPIGSGTNQNGKWLFIISQIPFKTVYYNSVGNQATVIFTCTANNGFYFINNASVQASNAVITNNGQIITFTLSITLPTAWAI